MENQPGFHLTNPWTESDHASRSIRLIFVPFVSWASLLHASGSVLRTQTNLKGVVNLIDIPQVTGAKMTNTPSVRRLLLLSLWAWFFVIRCPGAMIFETSEISQTVSTEARKAIAVFRFKNTGQNTVTIKSVQPNCGCTTAEITRQVYQAGETGEISVVFTFGDRIGPQKKIIQVETDDAPNKSISLILRVNINEPLICSTHLLRWRIGDAFSEQFVTIKSIGSRRIAAITLDETPEVAARIDAQAVEGQFRLIARPESPTKLINAAVACNATFTDGTHYRFTVLALTR